MVDITRKVKEIEGIDPEAIPYDALMEAGEPVILKGVAKDWPLVKEGLKSPQAAMDYLLEFYQGRPVVGSTGDASMKGRFFYNEDVSEMNFRATRVRLDDYLAEIREHLGQEGAPHYYIGSTDLDLYLPGFRAQNDLVLNNEMFERNPPLASIWIGNRTIASAHHDMSYNLACCVTGRRRFTLFPPEQVGNLYPGPLEPTPGGQVVSMVDFDDPDYERYPRFRQAEEEGQVAEMEPGDVLFYPALWWHHVEALADFNILVNYWWNMTPAFMDTPQNTLLHGLLSLRDRPQAEKDAWKAMFDYYVFGPSERAGEHLPEHARGPLGQFDDMQARRLRAFLLGKLNR